MKIAAVVPMALGMALVTALADTPALGSAVQDQDQVTFRGGVDLVTATVSVRDRRGRIIRDLKQSDFEILDSGQPRQIKSFEAGESPVSLAVLLDISGSMAVGGNIDRARGAVSIAMATLRARSDEAAKHRTRARAPARALHRDREPHRGR